MLRDGNDRVRRGVRLTVETTLFSLNASIADVPRKQRRSKAQFEESAFKYPHATCQCEPYIVKHYAFISMYDLDLRSCACHSVDTCTMIFNCFSYQRCPIYRKFKRINGYNGFHRLKNNI